mmetsp:Transcript_76481/g.212434  ORF Transcript_76481/g.212434 Transcript_76481/m.212434 type:complete len:205 (-) Transcript_76481:161-775(-)
MSSGSGGSPLATANVTGGLGRLKRCARVRPEGKRSQQYTVPNVAMDLSSKAASTKTSGTSCLTEARLSKQCTTHGLPPKNTSFTQPSSRRSTFTTKLVEVSSSASGSSLVPSESRFTRGASPSESPAQRQLSIRSSKSRTTDPSLRSSSFCASPWMRNALSSSRRASMSAPICGEACSAPAAAEAESSTAIAVTRGASNANAVR